MEVERGVEGSACRVIRDNVEHVCQFFACCGYQAQKSLARQAQVILVAHDALFHEAPAAIGDVGLLVLDEGFWTAGLRGVDDDAVLTIDGLRPVETLVRCYDGRNQPHHDVNMGDTHPFGGLWQAIDFDRIARDIEKLAIGFNEKVIVIRRVGIKIRPRCIDRQLAHKPHRAELM